MTKQEFVEEHRHAIAGWILGSTESSREGLERWAMELRLVMKRIDQKLGAIYDQLTQAPKKHKESVE